MIVYEPQEVVAHHLRGIQALRQDVDGAASVYFSQVLPELLVLLTIANQVQKPGSQIVVIKAVEVRSDVETNKVSILLRILRDGRTKSLVRGTWIEEDTTLESVPKMGSIVLVRFSEPRSMPINHIIDVVFGDRVELYGPTKVVSLLRSIDPLLRKK